jgi:3-hydroxybutyryl-CoA dehydrogenase
MASTIVEPIEAYALSKKDQPKVQFSKVGIVGCGTMGQNIARMISEKGIEVVFLELSNEIIEQSILEIEKELDAQIESWGMTESEKRAILSRIKGTITYSDFAGCDLVIEAILSSIREKSVEIRKEVFRQIEQNVGHDTIIATNSSTLVITELSSELQHKDRCISLHFPSTSLHAKIIEVARGINTSDKVMENIRKFVTLIGKEIIEVEESPGLISPRIICALVHEACNVYMEKVSSIPDIDHTMSRGFGLQLGPFELADKIGLDRIIRWMDNLYNEFGDIKYKAPPVLRRLNRAGYIGRKTAAGFYTYDERGKKTGTTLK